MNILVVGGCGHIGCTLVNKLKKMHHNMVVIDYRCKHEPFSRFFDPSIHTYNIDYVSNLQIHEILQSEKIELIIQAAGNSMIQESVVSPIKYYINNASGNVFLIEAALRANIKKFIFISSAAVFGRPDQSLITKSTSRKPISALGSCQVFTEDVLESVRIANDISYAILRASNIIGVNDNDPYYFLANNGTNFLNILFEYMLGKRSEIEIYGTDYNTVDKTAERDYIHINDFCDAVIKTIDGLSIRHSKQIFNVGTGKATSVKDMIKLCEKISEKSIKTIDGGPRFGDPDKVVIDPYETKQALDWRPKYESVEEILQKSWNLIKDNN